MQQILFLKNTEKEVIETEIEEAEFLLEAIKLVEGQFGRDCSDGRTVLNELNSLRVRTVNTLIAAVYLAYKEGRLVYDK